MQNWFGLLPPDIATMLACSESLDKVVFLVHSVAKLLRGCLGSGRGDGERNIARQVDQVEGVFCDVRVGAAGEQTQDD